MKEEENGWKHASPGLHVGQYLSGVSGMLFSTQVYFFFFLSFFKSMAPLHPGWSAPLRVIHNNIFSSTE